MAAILLVSLVCGPGGDADELEEYSVHTSPGGAYRILVLRRPLPFAMPGQAGDAPGVVRLLDRHGHVLRETDVEMVQMANVVEWDAHRVRIRFVADWQLPR